VDNQKVGSMLISFSGCLFGFIVLWFDTLVERFVENAAVAMDNDEKAQYDPCKESPYNN
jgi:hypothetical protein